MVALCQCAGRRSFQGPLWEGMRPRTSTSHVRTSTPGLAGGDKGVCNGGPDSGGVIAGEEIVFPAEPTGVYRTAGRCSSTATGDIDSSAVSSYAACPEAILSGYS